MSNILLSEKELRINNIINWQIGKTILQGIVTSVSVNRIVINHKSSVKPSNCYGVFLSQEWLTKFGLEHEDELNWWNLPKGNPYSSCHLMQFANGWGWFMSFDDKEEHFLIKGFEFVHQFQNLYWELTETELTTNNFIF